MGKHEGQGSAQPTAAEKTNVTSNETAASSLTAPGGPSASTVGTNKRPDPYHAPHESGRD